MKYTIIPNTNLSISKVCLGTMTFGEQNTESEAHEQLSFAVSQGINFIDTAEMYPIAARKETLGSTERFIGSWLKKRGKRDDLVIATKIAGPNRGMEYIRKPLDFSAKSINEAVDLSLKNLQTDYIDLYQMHWPERVMNMFGKRGLTEIDSNWKENIADVLFVYDKLIKAGKIRHIGVSNEAPWAVMKFISESEKNNLPRIATIQNPYSLLNRLFEVGLTEVCMRENIGLMAYSPLGFGILSGKHLNGTQPNSRIALFPQFTRYTSENATKATKLYQELANSHGLTLSQMALAFVQQQPFVMSTIIGATSIEQLKENIDAHKIVLSKEILNEIDLIQEMIPNPAP
ncbi:NADP(H)-dependent aldo-keto reductase [Flavobacterium piscinae]|uniref:Protein tas n=1 Tax=Flavobacterium piscinae TaxID=2506424 RepID=A0A4Q1KWT7_9FLAO|nr:NADP(H)-dependent aldo-keto reductase [Flavobacterium piscinae]RXR34150.1 NADP(H)-dependent aldo-keto reductase [Flavobacterium piscinae]